MSGTVVREWLEIIAGIVIMLVLLELVTLRILAMITISGSIF